MMGDRWAAVGLALQVVGTGLVAVLFQPVRRRLNHRENRVVYGHRATPYEALSALSRQAAQTPDESSFGDIAELRAEGTGARRGTTVPGATGVRSAAEVTP